MIKIGLVQGRHDMPVDRYLLLANIAEQVGYHVGVFLAAQKAAREINVAEEEVIVLFVTGLTNAALGAMLGFVEAGRNIIIASFDNASKDYEYFWYNQKSLALEAVCANCHNEVVYPLTQGALYCDACARNLGVACTMCGHDAGNGAGGYSWCCGAPLNGTEG